MRREDADVVAAVLIALLTLGAAVIVADWADDNDDRAPFPLSVRNEPGQNVCAVPPSVAKVCRAPDELGQ